MAKIKKDTSLRKAILQAAITGQLISDVERETETGKQLLDRIIEERNKKLLAEWEEKLKENLKTKKPTQIVASEIDDDEIPFEIPESWCWVRGKNIFAPMESIKPYGERFIYIDTDAVNNKLNIIDNPKNLLVKDAPSRASRKLHNGDVLFSMVRPYLKNIAYVDEMYSTAIASTGFYVMTQIGMYNSKFLFYAVLSPYVIDGLHQFMKGDNSPSINTTDIDDFLFPLPPLAVQNAIVAKLEEVLPFVDAYENVVLQQEELKNALPDKVKKAILQEAIQGKLTESWRKSQRLLSEVEATETGKQLLDRIIEERNTKFLADWEEAKKKTPKAKKPTLIVASEIDEEEIPFEIPESWCWCRLGEIGDVIMGQSPDGNAVKESGAGIEFHQGKIFFGDDYLKKSNQITTESTKIVGSDTILLCVRAPVGKVNLLDRDICIGRGLCALRPVISKKFVYYILQALESEFNDKATGTTFKAISKDIIFEQLLPLPPLAEQKKIVEIIEQILPLCEKLGG